MVTLKVADRRRDIAIVLLIPVAAGVWDYFHPSSVLPSNPAWLDIAFAVALVAISLGIWKAWEWARWACGLVGILSCANLIDSFWAMVSRGDLRGSSSALVPLGMMLFFALFWAAVAFYCLRPSTGKLFAHVRASRAHPGAAMN
jgi:hypothetical protein